MITNETETKIEIGRLLRAGTSGFVVGCRVSQLENPSLGALVRVPQSDGFQIYGIISDINIDDDGLVRQLVTAQSVEATIIQDNRLNRNVPLEIHVIAVGYSQNGQIYHLLPPRPPLSLDLIYLCSGEEIRQFTDGYKFGYFRHILAATDMPVSEIIAAHLKLAGEAYQAAGESQWISEATQELITLLRDDYPTLMRVLNALGDTRLFEQIQQ